MGHDHGYNPSASWSWCLPTGLFGSLEKLDFTYDQPFLIKSKTLVVPFSVDFS